MNKFMMLAIKEAEKGIRAGHGGPFGSVIVKDGKIIAKGHNRVIANNDPTCHGEIDAIRRACKKLKTWHLDDCTLYSTMEPCVMCSGAIIQSRIKKIVYSISNNSFGNIENNEYLQKNKYEIVKIDNKEMLELVQKFFKKLR